MKSNSDILEETASASASFFENSCPGNHCFSKTKDSEATASFTSEDSRPRSMKRKPGGAGGYTCCVSGCYNNSKKLNCLSFRVFPGARVQKKACYVKCRYIWYQENILCQHQAIESTQNSFKDGKGHN